MSNKLILSALAGTLMVAAVPAEAVVITFSTVTQSGGGKNIYFNRNDASVPLAGVGGQIMTVASGVGTTPTPDLSSVQLTFSEIGGVDSGPINATFLLNATTLLPSVPFLNGSGGVWQSGFAGFFELRSTGAFSYANVNFGANTLLLRGEFDMAMLEGTNATSSTGNFHDEGALSNLQYSSAVVPFISNASDAGFGITLTSITPNLNSSTVLGVTSPADFYATGSGTFSADILVPEPATWGLMLLGFGLVGAGLRRRSGQAIVTA